MYRYAHHHLCLASHLHHSSILHLLHTIWHHLHVHNHLCRSTIQPRHDVNSIHLLDHGLCKNNRLCLLHVHIHHHHITLLYYESPNTTSEKPHKTMRNHSQHTPVRVHTISCGHAHRRRDTKNQSPHIDTLLPLECTHLCSQPKHNRLSRALCRLGM